MVGSLKRVFLGEPIASSEEQHQRLGKPTALAVFASDAISSTAYATEEILVILMAAVAFPQSHTYLVPIALAAVLLLAIVTISYRQTVYAYPNGGGAYMVSRENISQTAALVAGASLMVDYTLTVAVSVSSGVLAIGSAFNFNDDATLRILLALFFVGMMTLANLRGVKESGRIFAIPTYVYVALLGLLLAVGMYHVLTDSVVQVHGQATAEAVSRFKEEHKLLQTAGLFVILKAFSSGAVVLSGVEAISNGVPAFRKPESKNAATTLVLMAVILGVGFLGISTIAHHYQPVVEEGGRTVLAQLGGSVFGNGSVLFYALQFGTFAILILAANTAYNGFPGLSSIIARDGFLPRQLATRGDRLVFSNGILILAGMASVLIVVFRAEVTLLIPLYAVGVFTGFTLSQFGMCRHHLRFREPHWQRSLVINAVGCFATGLVLIVVVVSKFTSGAWVPAVVIPLIVLLFKRIHSHYDRIDESLSVPEDYVARRRTHTVVVLVGKVTKGSLEAIAYARSLHPDRLLALTVVSSAEQQERILDEWDARHIPVDLELIHSPYRELSRPVLEFVDELDADVEDDFLTVVIPEFVLPHWWQQLLHNQSALVLRTRLRARPNTVLTSVPFHIGVGGQVQVSVPERSAAH
jgi:amino acid transporter